MTRVSAIAQAAKILDGLNALERNTLAAWGTAFTTYEDLYDDDVCRELVLQARAWSMANYDAEGRWCGAGAPP